MDDLIRKSDAIDAVKEYLNLCCLTGAKFHKEAKDYNEEIAMEIFENIPAVEPNLLIAPETIERGDEVYIGEDIVVVHQEDYMDIKCKAMMWDEYGEESKQGERIPTANRKEYDTPKGKIVFSYDGYGIGRITLECMDMLMDMVASSMWIPCSERLPEAGVSVIVTSKGGYVYTSNIAHGEWEYGGNVIAWMPLPKPWKGADEQKVQSTDDISDSENAEYSSQDCPWK